MQLIDLRGELEPLAGQGAFVPLLARARELEQEILLGGCEEAYLLYQIGRAYVGLGNYGAALVPIYRSLQIQPDQGHAHYLLGYVLAQQKQWRAALRSQQLSCGLMPELADAWYEQGRVALQLESFTQAEAALRRAQQLRPSWRAPAELLWTVRFQSVLAAEGLQQAASVISLALAESVLPAWFLRQCCQLAAAHLLAGYVAEAQLLLQALVIPTPSVEACSHPFPQRFALFLLVLSGWLQSSPPNELDSWASSLRATLWHPPCSAEHDLWPDLVEPFLWLMVSRWSTEASELVSPKIASLLKQVVQILKPDGVQATAIDCALEDCLSAQSDDELVMWERRLRRSQFDLSLSEDLFSAIAQGREYRRRLPVDHRVMCGLDRALRALSSLMMDRPNSLVILPGQELKALALRRKLLDVLVKAQVACVDLDGQPPAPSRNRLRLNWLFIASPDLPQCVLYRVNQKCQHLRRLGAEVRIIWCEQLDGWAYTSDLLWADAVVVCRLAATSVVLRAMAMASRFGLPLFYDVDDLLFDPNHCPPPLESYGGTLRPSLRRRFSLDVPLVAAAMLQADGLIFSTPTLLQRWVELFPDYPGSAVVLPNLAPAELLARATPPHADRPLRLAVASGTTAHKQAWQDELGPALALVLEVNPQVGLDLLGHIDLPIDLLAFTHRIRVRPFTTYEAYLGYLGDAAIGLVVLEPGTFTDAKSAIRWMEFSLMGLASVLSPTATYAEILEPDRDALFASGIAQWVDSVQLLIDEPSRRLDLARTAYQRALELFGPHRADAFWRPMLMHAELPACRKRKLLVVNVFFSPQSVGGATRVVQDQVRQCLEQAGDRYEVTVLCADTSLWYLKEQSSSEDLPNLAVDCHGWHGARVVRLGVKPKPWDLYSDLAVEGFCRDWFASEGFDLIHAHCLQLLTAAPLVIAAELGIPYVVTLHDGWWLSPCLFLTTKSGKPIDVADPHSHHDDSLSQPIDVLEADLHRRRHLHRLLAGAAARLTVSQPFAGILQKGGIADVRVIENDWQPMASTRSCDVRASSEPLRLCFVAGLALHKGFAVLQAALLGYPLSQSGAGAMLTIIDSRLRPDDSFEIEWNGTPVRFCASVPMSEMPAFYANHDVLVAPSICPESYGLVTREALSAGLWVVASDIGALADPIDHGRNGHRVPPGDADALGAVLLELCRQHPTPQPLLHFSGRAAAIDQLLPLYDRLAT